MRIDSSGNVGIGTSTPAYKLDVDGSAVRFKRSNRELVINPNFSNANEHSQIQTQAGMALSFATNGSVQAMRIDTSGNVGIGTTSPDAMLHVRKNQKADTAIEVSNLGTAGASTSSSFIVSESEGVPKGWFRRYRDGTARTALGFSEHLVFEGGIGSSPTERMRIDSAGNVGIGTSSPSTTLDVHSSANGHGLYIAQDNAGYGYHTRLTFQGSNGSGGYNTIASLKAYQEANGTNGYLRFDTNGDTERMRIDSSGNLLVGKTANDNTTVGFKVENDGFFSAVANGNTTCVLNRLTSDGEIAIFRKDGTTVGSIGTNSGYVRIGTGDTNLLMHSVIDTIVPHSGSANRDAAINLGYSGARFKDLYLSGGVHLGGTGSANKLDDYEEGTWTPTIIGSTGGSTTMTVARNNYTKVGNMCTAYMYVNAVDTTGTFSGDVRIGGLPFAAGNNFEQAVTVTYCNLFNFDEADRTVSGYVSGTQIWLHNGSSIATISTSNLNSASDGATMLAVTYRTA